MNPERHSRAQKNPDPWGDLTEAEQAVIEAAETGELCELGEGDPAEGEKWGEDRSVQAKVIYALCCGTGPDWPVHAKGVRIKGARIKDSLDFEDATLRAPLHLIACYFERPVGLLRARARAVVLSGSHVPSISADELRTDSSFLLDHGFSAKGKVSLLSATIGSNLECDGGSFENPEGLALSADGLDCKGGVLLRGLSAKGEVSLLGATIGSNLECDGGSFENPEGLALSADGLDCKGGVFLRQGFSAKGEVRLLQATIGGDLACTGGSFENPRGKAISADGLDCKGSVYLRHGFSAKGEVRLLQATIGGAVACTGGSFESPEGNAILADGLDCKGGVFLRQGFSAKGAVRLLEATIGGAVSCTGGSFENPEGTALELKGASASRVDLRRLASPPVGIVNLMDATVGSYMDDHESWPQPAHLRVKGFRYSSIDPREVALRREWLQLAPFSNQPYAQLAAVLKTGGSSEAAQRILIEQQRERLRRGQDSLRTRLGLRFLGLTVGFGYKPGRALWALLGFFLLGWILFGTAGDLRMMAPTSTIVMASDAWRESREIGPAHADYPPFQAALYSLDTLVPVIRLGMESRWQPSLSAGGPFAGFVSWYLRVHIAMGWVLTSLAVLGFTGAVRPR